MPARNHPYEQTGYLLSGKLNFRIDEKWHVAKQGDSCCIPENVEHEAQILEDFVDLELFSTIKANYLPEN